MDESRTDYIGDLIAKGTIRRAEELDRAAQPVKTTSFPAALGERRTVSA